MSLDIVSADPLQVLKSTKNVLENSKFAEINNGQINKIIKSLKNRLTAGLDTAEAGFGAGQDFKTNCQLIFVEDTLNFCFWAEKDKEKWNVEWPKGTIVTGGWYGLKACFERAIASNVPILDANYLANFSEKHADEFFKSSNGVTIPLLRERIQCVREAGSVLLKKYDGQFLNLIEEANFDAIKIVGLVTKNFTSYNDVAELDNQIVYLYKRAQIAANDLSYLSRGRRKVEIKRLSELTALADYKIPQILRAFGIISYAKELAGKVDNYVLIPKGSREEIEIRSATIWAVELIRQKMPKYTAGQIDNAIWLISQDQSKVEKPYHRTYTIFY